MSNTGNSPILPVVPAGETPTTATSTSGPVDATTAGNAAMTNSSTGYTAATEIRSLADLRRKAPKLWAAMQLGIATDICRGMQHQADHLKQMMREYRERS